MKALTVRPPWSWSIAFGGKRIENRSAGAVHWMPTRNLAIHSGKTWSKRGATDERVVAAWAAYFGRLALSPESDERLRGGLFLAVVDLVDVHRAEYGRAGLCCRPWGEGLYVDSSGETITEVTHLVFENIRTLVEPVPWERGRLGLWTVPPGTEREILERVAA